MQFPRCKYFLPASHSSTRSSLLQLNNVILEEKLFRPKRLRGEPPQLFPGSFCIDF